MRAEPKRIHTSPTIGKAFFAKSTTVPNATCIIFVLLFVSVDGAFQVRTALESLMDTGEGSRLRQLVYLFSMLLSVGLVVRQFNFRSVLRLFPLSLIFLFCWAGITLLWSPVPDIGARRLVLTFVTATTIFCLASLQSPEELLRRFRQVVVALALVSLVLVIVAPELAIHQSSDPEPAVIGDWRGVFYHKNIFGAVLAPAALIAFYECLARPRSQRGMANATLVFLLWMLVMSGSKTSIGLSVMLMGLLWIMHLMSRRRGGLVVLGFVLYVIVFVTISCGILWMTHNGTATVIGEDAFTGRGTIWTSLLRLVEGRMMLGLGYHSVFQTGLNSPLAMMFSDKFLLTVAHAHSAYLETLVTMGWIGLALFIIALIIVPFVRFLGLPSKTAQPRLLILVLMLLTWLHGLLESGLFDRDRMMWVVFLVAYGSLRQMPERVRTA